MLKARFNVAFEEILACPENCYCLPFTFSEIKNAICNLKKEKASGLDSVSPEMVIYAGDVLVQMLTLLFNMCLLHGFVPESFGSSIIIPVVKDKTCNLDKYDNYRPISLVSMFSKVFELCLSERLANFVNFDELQFGFVQGKGCQKALFTIESVVNYFTARGSPVFLAALDASKAFDRVNHFGLFYKLVRLGLPLYLLNVLIEWHMKLSVCVLWNGVFFLYFLHKG